MGRLPSPRPASDRLALGGWTPFASKIGARRTGRLTRTVAGAAAGRSSARLTRRRIICLFKKVSRSSEWLVAKPTLAIQFPDQLWSAANTAEGHATFLSKLRALGPVDRRLRTRAGHGTGPSWSRGQRDQSPAGARLCPGLRTAGQDRRHRRGGAARLRREAATAGHPHLRSKAKPSSPSWCGRGRSWSQ